MHTEAYTYVVIPLVEEVGGGGNVKYFLLYLLRLIRLSLTFQRGSVSNLIISMCRKAGNNRCFPKTFHVCETGALAKVRDKTEYLAAFVVYVVFMM
jgi:hypothetical protein